MTMWGAPGFLVLLLLLTVTLFPVRDATQAEGDSLVAMMQKWGVSFPKWVAGGDPCSEFWPHVNCSGGNVVGLNLTNTGITGPLPSEIGDLQFLEVLDISNLYNALGLKNNSLNGRFPDSLAQCTQLRSFNASNVAWNIEFPSVIAKLPALEELYFSTANVMGTIPDDFYSLSNLRSLFLGNNNLDMKGELKKFANFKNMILLTMYQNDFTGTIPDELGSLPKLQYFNCHTCNLYGPLPDAFSQLASLQNITLQRNNLTGQIPDSWKGLTTIRNFRMDQNYLSGAFPYWMFTEWPDLNFLYISKNSFSGPTPNITDLELKYNVSYAFYTLRWDCNYLDGLEPCSATHNCSDHTYSRIEDEGFNFDKNCYSDEGQSDQDRVSTSCDTYHPPDVSCGDFYQLIGSGQCPRCPSNQVPWPGGDQKCVCQLAGSSSGGGGVPVAAVVGGIVALFVVFVLIIALVLYKRRKHFSFLDIFTVKARGDDYWEAPPGVERFSLQELAKVTQEFNDTNMIGKGAFGKVFVGTLDDGREVAIKRASAGRIQANSEFHNEVTLLSRLHHRHLVKLEGFCDEAGLQILVYEFMTKGNLHAHLLGKITTTPLHWYRRLEIAYGVAQGLEYLHSFADPPVIHRDVKPSNILLDDYMVAKLSDFGISKVSPEYDTHVSTRPAGTAGYLDPDYFLRRQLTTASDVYAYGVVMLELVTGQEAIDHTRHEEFNLIEWVRKRFRTAGIVSVIDPLIEHDYSPEAYTAMTRLGLQCASFDRSERPSMKVVLATLEPLMVIQTLDAEGDGLQGQEEKKSRRGMHITFDTEYLNSRSERTLLDLETLRSSPSEVVTNAELMSGELRPR